jgi:hypothetical protein
MSFSSVALSKDNLLQITWEKTYTQKGFGYFANCLLQTSDNGYLIGGTIGQYQVYQHGGDIPNWTKNNTGLLIKTDSLGKIEWVKNFKDLRGIYSIFSRDEGGFAYTAFTTSENPKYSFFKVDSEWNIQSNMTIPFGKIYPIGDGYVLFSSSHINKLDSTGRIIWNQTIADIQTESSLVSDTGFALSGNNGIGTDTLLIITDSNGKILSENKINTNLDIPSYYLIFSMATTEDKSILLVGRRYSQNDAFNVEGCLIKTDKDGNQQWIQAYGDTLSKVIQTKDGGCIVAGTDGYVFIAKYSASGLRESQLEFANNQSELPQDIISTSDGGYAIVVSPETYTSSTLSPAIILFKIAPDTSTQITPTATAEQPNLDPIITNIGILILIIALPIIIVATYKIKSKNK